MLEKALKGRWRHYLIPAAVAVAAVAIVFLARDQLVLPQDLRDDTVVATLGSKAMPYPAELRAAAARAREAPDDRAAALDAARRYMDYGRSIGDARFAGAALGALQPWLDGVPDPEILNAAAAARQYMHAFDVAVLLLDQAIRIDPHNAQALLSRANIRIVQGRLSVAMEDCRNLARARRADLAILCDTTAKALGSEAGEAFGRLDRLVTSNAIDPALRGYAFSLLGEMARFQLQPEIAREKFEAARSISPGDLRTLMVSADLELAEGRAGEALAMLKDAPPTDGIMVRQAIAHKALGRDAELARLRAVLRTRIETAVASGETAHGREAARFFLEVEGKPEEALAAASANWAAQRELEDALLFVASARAAGRPEAASVVSEWTAAEGVVAPMYLAAVGVGKDAPR